MDALRVHDLTKRFDGVHAVDRLSLAIASGTIVAIVGPNGSGKTTLLHMLSGMLPWDEGAVTLRGARISRLRTEDAPAYGITRTFQNVRLFEQMTVEDNILVVLTERSVFGAIRERHSEFHEKRAREILERVGLWAKKGELAVNLSYGQRKLLEIGRALAMDAQIIFFDEPFAGLFPEVVKKISDILLGLKGEGKTVVLVEHDMGLIRKLSDEVFVMDSGKLLAHGRAEDVLAKKEVVEAYLGA